MEVPPPKVEEEEKDKKKKDEEEKKDPDPEEEWPGISVLSAKFNKSPGRNHFLVTVDDKSNLRLWDW